MKRAEFVALGGAATLAPFAPPTPFGAARDTARAIIARDAADPHIRKEALPRLYEQGVRVDHAVVLLHGFTNVPQQFDVLAQRLYARRCNVYVPRLPRHGNVDRLTHDLQNLTLAELENSCADAYAIASGLGRAVTVIGLSLGGTMAMWMAQTQPVALALPVAPFLMPVNISRTKGMAAARLASVIPDIYFWWDKSVKEKSRPAYAYPGYPSHGMAQVMFLSEAIYKAAAQTKPLARRCVLVTNANDNAVNNDDARDVLARWHEHGMDTREVVLSDLGPPVHDIIDPTTFPQGARLVYPRLEELVLA